MKLINFLATDNVELTGILYSNENVNKENKRIILAVHGMSSNCLRHRDEVISSYANKDNIDYFCFNNRGSELVKYITINENGTKRKVLGGTTYEDVLEGFNDICGAIIMLKNLGYKNIYLQGHSLGCTKIVHTYNKLKQESNNLIDSIKGIILLSLVDIPTVLRVYLGDSYEKYIKLAQDKIEKGRFLDIMPKGSFIHPISVKSFLRYARDNREIDFINLNKDKKLSKLNSIEVPLFMRWGNVEELIIQNAKAYSEKINDIIQNKNKDITYIDGANHGYFAKEEELATAIVKFIEADK